MPLRAGEHVLGVRVNSETLGALVRDLFASRVTEPAEPPANLSVYLAPSAEPGGLQELHQLYDTYSLQLRTRDAFRTLEALWYELNVRDARWSGSRTLLDATVLVREGQAHVLPAFMRRAVVRDLRRWESAGYRLVDSRWVGLDLDAGCVTVPEPKFDIAPTGVRKRVHDLGSDHRSGPTSPVGHLPVASWTPSQGSQTPGERVMLAAAQILDRSEHVDGALLRTLTALLGEVADFAAAWSDDASLRAALQGGDASA